METKPLTDTTILTAIVRIITLIAKNAIHY